jgi:hypothetical protein
MSFAMRMTFFVSPMVSQPQIVINESVKEPDACLGAEIKKWTSDGGQC